MEHRFGPGDFLFFQLEAGFALIRILAIDESDGRPVWHVVGYHDLFPDTDSIEAALQDPKALSIAIPHVVLTNRAFESTQVARLGNSEVTVGENMLIDHWRSDSNGEIFDRSVRLLLGLR